MFFLSKHNKDGILFLFFFHLPAHGPDRTSGERVSVQQTSKKDIEKRKEFMSFKKDNHKNVIVKKKERKEKEKRPVIDRARVVEVGEEGVLFL